MSGFTLTTPHMRDDLAGRGWRVPWKVRTVLGEWGWSYLYARTDFWEFTLYHNISRPAFQLRTPLTTGIGSTDFARKLEALEAADSVYERLRAGEITPNWCATELIRRFGTAPP